MGVFKYSPELTLKVIIEYLRLFDNYFPDCSNDENSPISLSLSFANIKYPLRDHWRFFESGNNNYLNIHHQNTYKGSYSKKETELIMEVVKKSMQSNLSKSALYDVIQAFEKLNSEIELTLRLKDKNEDVYKLYVNEGIMPEHFLHMFQLLGGG